MASISEWPPLSTIAGVRVIWTTTATKTEYDLSRFRFLSFHKSKLKRNRPRLVHKPSAYQWGNVLMIHPALKPALLAQINEQGSGMQMVTAGLPEALRTKPAHIVISDEVD